MHWKCKAGGCVTLYLVSLGTSEGTFCIVLTTLNKRTYPLGKMYAQLPGAKHTDVPDLRLLREHTHTHTHTNTITLLHMYMQLICGVHLPPLLFEISLVICTPQVWHNKAIYCAVLFSVPYKVSFGKSDTQNSSPLTPCPPVAAWPSLKCVGWISCGSRAGSPSFSSWAQASPPAACLAWTGPSFGGVRDGCQEERIHNIILTLLLLFFGLFNRGTS